MQVIETSACVRLLVVYRLLSRDIIYGMKEIVQELVREKKKAIWLFLQEYGKVTIALGVLFVTLLTVVVLIRGATPQTLKVSFLDIGQGDAILIQTPSGHDMLIDGGPNNHILEKLSKKISYFDHHIDVVVSTHPDADHITGLIPVLLWYDVDHIIVSPITGHTGVFQVLQKSISDEHASIHIGKKGDDVDFGDGVVAHILYPDAYFHGNEKNTNDASVSLVVTYGDESILLTGDLPSTHEGELLQSILPHHVTIYKAGHHGSKYSSGEQLLSYIKPEYVVISAGKNNKYGHPNSETLERLKTYSQEILSTIDRGTITFSLDGKGVSIKTEK